MRSESVHWTKAQKEKKLGKEEKSLRELNSIGECECLAKTANACPTLGYPAYTHLIRIYVTNTCINYIKNEFITTPALARSLAHHTNSTSFLFSIVPSRRSFPFRIRFLSLTAVGRFLLEYLFAFHSDFDTPFLLLIILYGGGEARCVDKKYGCDGVVAVVA